LISYGFFNLCLTAYNSLYPIFISAPRPRGREFTPSEIGFSLSGAGLATAILQIAIFTPIQQKIGNRWGYRAALVLFSFSFFATPFVGINNEGKNLLWIEVSAALFLKTLATVIGLTCEMLLITNSCPSPNHLGAINGVANTLASGGRAIGPFLSGGLFSLASKVDNGEVLAWGTFGIISFVGTAMSIPITAVGETTSIDDRSENSSLTNDEQ